jgi:hypothetical protein
MEGMHIQNETLFQRMAYFKLCEVSEDAFLPNKNRGSLAFAKNTIMLHIKR